MVRFFKKKSKKTTNETANVASTSSAPVKEVRIANEESSLSARVREAKAKRSKAKEVDTIGYVRQVLIGSFAGCIIGISAIGLGKFSVLSILFVSIIICLLNQWGCIQVDWDRVEEAEKIIEENIIGEEEPKEKKTLAEKVSDETTYLLSSKEERKKKQISTIFQRFFKRTFAFIVSLLVGISIGLVTGILLFSK